MTANELKDFYNDRFLKDRRPVPVHASVTLVVDEQEIHIPWIRMSAGTTVHDMFKWLHMALDKDLFGEEDLAEEEPGEADDGPKAQFINFARIEHRNNIYLVEEREDDIWYIQRADNQKSINVNSPTGRTLIKLYKDSRNGKEQ